ncbi:hypothetical protein Calab_3153 [Caldithrix abyssi DSM 13497]|uniref:Cas10/Cmr2 second palm domain-containing protein n=1 Tax=Caldithrix abyssi DSM 13497 TaxID=880073 RepID=H1XUD3_CALAY|nr:hypothetical protein [Caldithrix abyssi]APF18781.1 hypothetical protein Cabys_2032 [Caldithrix abyssi DSM 13497]EHO42759.1 hypothetical protein Calab_3153 [Caldithrix abyssi DSM 13497]
MAAFLYGASIQGIQKFIFETKKLKEIVGASELVEQMSNELFQKEFKINEDDMIMHAAGNVRLLSEDEHLIKNIVKTWPKIVGSKAPGLVLSQAVVKVEGTLNKSHFDLLEKRLRIARNRQFITQPVTPMASIRSRRTGKAAIDWNDDGKPRDCSSKVKQEIAGKDAKQNLMEKSLGENAKQFLNSFAMDVTHMMYKDEETGWLAVIHADGNNMGKLIQLISQKLEKNQSDFKDFFKKFSEILNKSTIAATEYAVNQIILPEKKNSKKLPFRPVVVGGDDLTIIIRADLALSFTEVYLKKFNEETTNNFKELAATFSLDELKNGLTACAGIAYMKDSFPFHYAVDLAESLCADAKKYAKQIDKVNVPSALLFHKVYDSFVDDYSEIEARELTAANGISFKYGPYGTDGRGLASINELKEQVELILRDDSPRSGIRKWLSLLHNDLNKANLWLERVKEITGAEFRKKLNLETAISSNKTHLFDVLTIASISKKRKGGKH